MTSPRPDGVLDKLEDQPVRNIIARAAASAGWDRAGAAVESAHLPKTFGDATDRLPEAARDKLTALKQERYELNLLARGLSDQIEEQRALRRDADNRRLQLLNPAAYANGAPAEDDPLVLAETAKVEKTNNEIRRLQALYETRSGRWNALGQLIASIEKWVTSAPGNLVMHEGEAPTLRKNESLLTAIERIRSRTRELEADERAVRAAPMPSALVKEKITAEVEALARRGAPDVFGAIKHRGEGVKWPSARADVVLYPAPGTDPAKPVVTTPDTLALLAWLAKDELVAALTAEIDARADDGAALTHEQRADRLAEIDIDLLNVERDEEALVEMAHRAGTPVDRRPDASPLAVLGLALA
jgi:hypothetical protein